MDLVWQPGIPMWSRWNNGQIGPSPSVALQLHEVSTRGQRHIACRAPSPNFCEGARLCIQTFVPLLLSSIADDTKRENGLCWNANRSKLAPELSLRDMPLCQGPIFRWSFGCLHDDLRLLLRSANGCFSTAVGGCLVSSSKGHPDITSASELLKFLTDKFPSSIRVQPDDRQPT